MREVDPNIGTIKVNISQAIDRIFRVTEPKREKFTATLNLSKCKNDEMKLIISN
jgi:hypothetical protein